MKKLDERPIFLRRTVILFLIIISTSFSLAACLDKGDSAGNPELTPYSPEIYVSGEWLYYDGPKQDAGLFAYNLETEEKVKITGEQGTLLKISHGFYYSVGMKVYEVNGLSLELLCVIPKEAVWADYNNGKAYWYGTDEALYTGSINEKKWILEESVQMLYQDTADNYILWVKILDDRAFLDRNMVCTLWISRHWKQNAFGMGEWQEYFFKPLKKNIFLCNHLREIIMRIARFI